MKVNPYLGFDGNCREAFEFYEKCLGGKIEAMIPHRETPAAEHVGPEWQDKIIHACLSVADQLLMGGDSPPGQHAPAQGFSVSITTADSREAERIYRDLSAGGSVQMPMEETFWALRFGMVTDRFGTPWMVNCPRPA